MTAKPKTCPACGQDFYQRQRNCCPHCGIALVLVRNKLMTVEEVREDKRRKGDSKAVLTHYLARMREAGSYLHFPVGTTAWVQQLCFAKALIGDAYKFLGYNSRKDLDPTEFAIAAMDAMFDDEGKRAWLKSKDSLRTCNGGMFFKTAPDVLRKIAQSEDQAKADRLFSVQSPMVGVPILG